MLEAATAFGSVAWLLAAGLSGVSVVSAVGKSQNVSMKTALLILLGFVVLTGTFAAGAGAGYAFAARRLSAQNAKMRADLHAAWVDAAEEGQRADASEQKYLELQSNLDGVEQ